jgi:argininosuccinate lyase
MRIWLLEQVEILESLMKDLLKVTIARAESEIDHIMPGYTHLQVSCICFAW